MSARVRPFVALSWMLAGDFRRAALPLLEAGEVEALEWSFDTAFHLRQRPPWLDPLLNAFAAKDRLVGHGVTYSPLSAHWGARQEDWLARLRAEAARRRYRHVSEHFGFMSAGDFHQSSPMPVPRTAATLRVGRDRLARLREACGRPVGIENLAFAFDAEDASAQGDFLDALLDPVDGFLVLDLHNIHCQALNFGLPAEALMRRHPLHRVRELHVSGGSDDGETVLPGGRTVRRDTHDGPVPAQVFDLAEAALALCPGVEIVVFERLGGTLGGPADDASMQADFRTLRARVDAARPGLPAPGAPEAISPLLPAPEQKPATDAAFAAGQGAMLHILHTAPDPAAALAGIRALGGFDTMAYDLRMVETAMKLVRKWGVRDGGQGG